MKVLSEKECKKVVVKRLETNVSIYDEHCCIIVDALMQQIEENHLADQMSFERFLYLPYVA